MRSSIISTIALMYLMLNITSIALANTYNSIEYNLDLVDINKSILRVEVILKGIFEDELILDLPSKWAGIFYIDQIRNIQASSGTSVNLKQEDLAFQAIITIPKTSSTSVRITYEVHQKIGNPSNIHEAIIRNDLVHAPGYGIFAVPHGFNETDKIKVTINWLNLNSEWKILSSYSTDSSTNLNIIIPELLHAIYVAGKVRVYSIETSFRPVLLSLYGGFNIEDKKIISDLKQIIKSQRAFFKDSDFPYYAISLVEESKPESMEGTRLLNSFTGSLPYKLGKTDYYIFFAHEHLHNWIGGKIRNNEDEELNYWWSEGFTEFYARLIALRSKGIDKNTFIQEANQILRAYYLSSVNQEPNSRIKRDFWNDRDVEKLPYYRGFVFALYLNNLIKRENPNNSLDSVLHDLLKASYKKQFSASLFKSALCKYIKNGIEKEFSNFIDKGSTIRLEDINLPIEKILMGRYYLGFNRDTFIKNNLIQEIDTKSNAYKAGLRNGQKVIEYDCPKGRGDPDQTITVKTINEIFKFKPEHYDKVEIYQFKPNFSQLEAKQFAKFFDIK